MTSLHRESTAPILAILAISAFLLCIAGYFLNIEKLVGADVFQNEEVIRAAGIIFPPIGVIMGLFVQ